MWDGEIRLHAARRWGFSKSTFAGRRQLNHCPLGVVQPSFGLRLRIRVEGMPGLFIVFGFLRITFMYVLGVYFMILCSLSMSYLYNLQVHVYIWWHITQVSTWMFAWEIVTETWKAFCFVLFFFFLVATCIVICNDGEKKKKILRKWIENKWPSKIHLLRKDGARVSSKVG